MKKKSNLLLYFCLFLTFVLLTASPSFSQTGNQSDAIPNLPDTTTVNPPEPVNPPVNPPAPSERSETSSGTSGNPAETINPGVTPSETSGSSSLGSSSESAVGAGGAEIDRAGFEGLVQQGSTEQAIQGLEEAQAVEFSNQLGLELYGKTPTNEEIAIALGNLHRETGKKPVLIYLLSGEKSLEILCVFPQYSNENNLEGYRRDALDTAVSKSQTPVIRKSIPDANRASLEKTLKEFRSEVTNRTNLLRTDYLNPAQKLHQWLIAPVEPDLQAHQADILVFVMDSGLRSLPIAALHDGQQFLVEKYALALIPSFGLTDTRYVNVSKAPILAMGASQFADQAPLPAVPLELSNIREKSPLGKEFLNEEFTLEKFKSVNRQERFGIIHLATHGEFQPGALKNSYIQFSDTRLTIDRLPQVAQELGWNANNGTPVELLVLSACRTALGSEEAELGFAGLAVQAGVKSALASLWYVSDIGTLALMNEFYRQLKATANKAEALRQTQIALLTQKVRIEDGEVFGADGEVIPLPSNAAGMSLNLSHPYYWSAFTLIGNWN